MAHQSRTQGQRFYSQSEVFQEPVSLNDLYLKTVMSDKLNGRRKNAPPIESVHLGVQIYATLTVIPNQTATEVAKSLGVSRERVVSMLATMEGIGLLLAEDDDGRLTVWRQAENPIYIGGTK